MKQLRAKLRQNIVFLIFILLGMLCILFGKQSPAYIVGELVSRFSRNAISILSLIVPVLCGMGLNFGIVLGAMAGELGIILALHWEIDGVGGILLAMLLGSLFSTIFGYLTGRLYNKTKGQETLTGMILGYFAFGLFNLILINLVGTVIPFKDDVLMLSGGVGLRDTISLAGLSSAFDDVCKITLYQMVQIIGYASLGLAIMAAIRNVIKKQPVVKVLKRVLPMLISGAVCVILLSLTGVKEIKAALKFTRVPVLTWVLILFVALLTAYITNTRWGQKVRTIGQNRKVATASGIHVNKIRIEAVIVSTIIASWGQIISLQNLGTMNTYTAHEMVGTYAVAALLVGGATLNKATIGQALVGCLLFHLLFFMAPIAARNLFQDAMIGEYFRMFLSYGIIVLSLVLYAWNRKTDPKIRRRA